jgi:hypothetical protein
MPITLEETYTGSNIYVEEYNIEFSSIVYAGSAILFGYDYSTNTVLAKFGSEVIVVGNIPTSYFSSNSPFRILITVEVNGTNNTPIPYSMYFDFSENGEIVNSTNSINPFLSVLPRPIIAVSTDNILYADNVDIDVDYNSDAIDSVTIEIRNTLNVIVFQQTGLPANGTITVSNLLMGNYTVYATAYNEPLISTEDTTTFSVYATDKNVVPNSFVNGNIINNIELDSDLLPVITSLNVIQLSNNTVEVFYETINATRVDLVSGFYIDVLNLPANGSYVYNNLSLNTIYTVTAIASDDELNVDVKSITFELSTEGLNTDRGFLGLKRGLDMTFAVSPGVYTKETDLSFVAEPFSGTHGSFAGKFKWGPCLERVRVGSEDDLVAVFGKPSTNLDNEIDFLTAASFLKYSNALDVVRIASYNGTAYLNTNSTVSVYYNTLAASSTAEDSITVLNDSHYTNMLDGDLENNTFFGRFTGELGNSVGISFVLATDVSPNIEHSYNYDLSANKDSFYFSRAKTVSFVRTTTANTVRSIFDLGDWLEVDGERYNVKGITLGSDNAVTGLSLVSGGAGYSSVPSVSFTGGGVGATGSVTLATTGSIKAVAITSGGTYADDGSYAIAFTGGGGTGATATATVSSGAVTLVTISSGGSGYTSAPTATVTYTGTGTPTAAVLSATVGYAIASVTLSAGGSGYTSPSIVLTGGTPTTAATITVASGSIDTITIDRIYNGVVSTGSAALNTIDNTAINALSRYWKFSNLIGLSPSENSAHVVVYDLDGKITGVAGSIIEKYSNASFSTSAKNEDGTSNYINDRINTSSQYIRIGTADITTIPLLLLSTEPLASGKTYVSNTIKLVGGSDAFTTMGLDDDISGYDLFKNPEETDAPVIIGNCRSIVNSSGSPSSVLANYLLQNIAEFRKDTVVFLSCRRESVVNNPKNEVREILRDVATLPSTSYGEMDSGWKYTYDRYNDRYVWIPVAGDHAGCYARTDRLRDTWFSAAGEQRGIIQGVVKLAFNPNETQRDQLYPNRVNPVVTFPQIGTMIYGDKTLLSLSSSFNRIPTRRLFITIEKTLANASRFALFEFNDEQTRNQVRGIIEPYLRDVKAGRGIEDFLVDVSENVNTPQVVANNQFKGRIFIKPKYSINFIELEFVNVGAILSFTEAQGLL